MAASLGLPPRHFYPLSRRLDAPELAWLLDRPLPYKLLFPGVATFGLLWSLGIFPEGRLINPFEQYTGVFPGDLFLWVATAALLFLATRYFEYREGEVWYTQRGWKVLVAVVAVTMLLLIAGGDAAGMILDPDAAASYTLAQFFSPTHLAHLLIVPMMTYIIMRLMWPVLVHTDSSYRKVRILKVVVIVGYSGWVACAIILDNFVLERPNLDVVHPADGGWLGGWYRDFWTSFTDSLVPKPLFDQSR